MNAMQTTIKNMLVEIYGDELSPCMAEAYATELYADIFEDCCALDSVYATAYRLETEVFGERRSRARCVPGIPRSGICDGAKLRHRRR